MASFNRVILVGNLTRDVEIKYLPTGTAVTEVGLAVNDRRKTATGEWIEETTFVEITLWGRQAEVASEYLGKGSQVLIEGRLKLDTWEKDGHKNYKLRVVGEKMQMLGGRGGGGGGGNAAGSAGGGRSQRPEFDESEFSHSGSSSTPAARPASPAAPANDDIPF